MPTVRDRITELRRVPARDLIANPKNWRTHPKAQQAAMSALLGEIGYADALIARETPEGLVLIDGHLRAETTPDDIVPVLVLDVTEAEADKLLLTLDPLAAMAEADKGLLEALLGSVQAGDDAVARMLEDLAKREKVSRPAVGLTDPDDVPPTPDEPTTRPGDLWLLGEHRLLCGDATKAEDVERVMDGERASLVFTSPPYAAQREYTLGKFDWDELMDGMASATIPILADDATVLVNLGLVHSDGLVNVYWEQWLKRTATKGLPLYGWYVWDQGWGLPGDWAGRLAPSFEFVFHLSAKPTHTRKTVETLSAGKVRNSTFRHADGSLREFTGNGERTGTEKVGDSVIRVNRQIGAVPGGDHPAVFSVAFPEYCIPVWTDGRDSVYDPFLGSSTTLIACERLGRRCYAMEIEPRYVDVAVRRWESYTGKTAVLAPVPVGAFQNA